MAKLIGSYEISNANLYPTFKADFQLVISKRHRESARKPKEYLLMKQAGRFLYISSLYPDIVAAGDSEAQIWQFEYKGTQYLLNLKRALNEAEITLNQVRGGRGTQQAEKQNA